MSRIGRKIISIPAGVTVQVNADDVVVKGPKGELKVQLLPGIQVAINEPKAAVAETAEKAEVAATTASISVSRSNDDRQTRAYHGLIRSLLNNAVIGVSQGYKKTLKLIGTGYRVTAKGQGVSLALGFSHPVEVMPEAGVKLTIDGNDTIYIEGIDKHMVGQVAANIRKIRPPEPYKGKGVRYDDEVVRRKAGKTATK